MQIKYMLFLRMIIGNQISTIYVSFNKEKEGYEKTSLSNECAEVISTNHEKVKIVLEGLSTFDLESVTTVNIQHLQHPCTKLKND